MKKITSALLSFFVVLALSIGAEAQLVIDDFNSGTTTAQLGAGTSSSPNASVGILGGNRIDSVVVPNLSGAEFFGSLGFNNGNLILSQGSQDEIIGGIEYNGLNGTDLTGGGAFQNFLLDFTSLDSPDPLPGVLQLSVTSDGVTQSQNITIPDQNSSTEVSVNFSNFGDVDLAAVDSVALQFDFTGNPGRDLQLGSFGVSAVPEPGSLTFLSCAVTAMLLRRRRK